MAATNTTTTVVTTTNTREGFRLNVDTSSQTQQVGNFVTDVSIQPYIASRIVSFFAYNLRPNQRIHVFFDSVNVDEFCAPGIIPATITNTADYNSIQKNGNWGDPIRTNELGVVAGQFNIPAGRFRTGDRVLQLTDVDNLALGNNAFTTIASAVFTASNLTVTRQGITLTTVNPEISYIPVTNTVVTTNTSTQIDIIPDIVNINFSATEPIAQALTINTPQGQDGIFATSLTIYFKQRSQVSEHGVTIYLCETDNGYPNGSAVLPFSRVHKNYNEISISNNGSVGTTFTFDSPVFLANGKTYAFVVKPDANDPDYFVFSANLGDIDLQTGYQVFSQPLVGTAFYGATENQWTALQTEYIKFELNRASFRHNTGVAVFNNTDMDFLTIFNVGYVNNSVDILPGDYVFESTNAVSNATGGSANTSKKGIVEYYNYSDGVLYVANSSGAFTSNSYIQVHRFSNSSLSSAPNNSTLIAYANTGLLYDPGLNSFVPQFASIAPAGTTISYSYQGTANNYSQVDTTDYRVIPGYETEFYDYERIVASKSNEVSSMSSNKSMTLKANLTTETEYLSPVIDTVRYQELIIKNDIDPVQFEYDEYFNSGVTKSKYISQVITLAQGQDAEDLQIILTAYRPPGTDIQVWVKFLNGDDTDIITDKTWVPLLNNGIDLYSDPSNPNNFKEFVYTVGEAYNLIPTTGTITAANSSNVITGTGTVFQDELQPGWYINMRANQQALQNVTPYAIVANTVGFDNVNNAIKANNSTFSLVANNRVYYSVPSGNTPIAPLTGNTFYYVSWSNTTAFALSTSMGGANIDITDSRTTNPGEAHNFYKEEIKLLNERTRKIISISSNTSLQLDAPFVGNYTDTPYFLVAPPTTAWLSTNNVVQITGTVNTYTTNNSIIGSGTDFLTELSVGQILEIADDSQTIVSISNSTYLTVGTPWSSNNSSANAFSISKSGVVYLNDELNLYSSFKQFQIKIILQSDDSSKVPQIDDLRALALQM